MRITYDPYADAAYIYFDKHPDSPGCVGETVVLTDDVAVDFGRAESGGKGEVIGIEVLSAAENLGLSRGTRSIRLEILGKPVALTAGEPPRV
jgi:uncharacterized protein YuzE